MSENETRKLLIAATNALKSYQYGNQAPDLAKSVSEAIDTYLNHIPTKDEIRKTLLQYLELYGKGLNNV